MTTNHDFFSAKTEAILKQIIPGSVALGDSSGGFCHDLKLTTSECGGALTNMSRARLLTLMIYIGAEQAGERKELADELVKEWESANRFAGCFGSRRNLERLTLLAEFALEFIAPLRLPGSNRTVTQPNQAWLANALNMSAYSIRERKKYLDGLTWWQVYQDASHQLTQHLHDAAAAVHQNLSKTQ